MDYWHFDNVQNSSQTHIFWTEKEDMKIVTYGSVTAASCGLVVTEHNVTLNIVMFVSDRHKFT